MQPIFSLNLILSFLIYVLILFGNDNPENLENTTEQIKFSLSEKQQQNGWYLEYMDNDIAKVMHPVYGYLKHVKLTAPEINLNKTSAQNLQVIELYNIDTVQFHNMYVRKDLFPASGSIGYPVQIGDYNHNGLIDFNGAYKWIQDFDLNNACVVELSEDSAFFLKKIYLDSITIAQPISDLDNNGWDEMNYRRKNSFAQLKSTTKDSFPDTISFLYNMWNGGGGAVSAETLVDLDKDGKMDLIYVGDDTLEPAGKQKIYVAEYNKDKNNFEEKFRHFPEDYNTYGFSYGDFDNDGYTEFVTGSIHGDVYIFENNGNDSYSLVNQDTLSTSNAYLTVATNDIDNNRKAEFFVGGSSYFNGIGGTRFYWFEADGNNNYSKQYSFLLLGVDPLSWDEIHAFDANNDGKLDILINYTYAVVILTWNNSSKEFEVYHLSYWDYPVHGVTMYDLNNDNKLDYFLSTKENDKIPALRTYYFENKTVTSISPPKPIPSEFRLFQNYPNPFNNNTQIKYRVPKIEKISLTIFNILGKEVKTLISKKVHAPGEYIINWNAIDNNGKEVASGLYIYVLSNGKQTLSGKMLLIK